MADITQSTQTQSTTAPTYYTDYLSNLASQGQTAANNAQFVGAQPLQQQAFDTAGTAVNAYRPTLDAAGNTLNQAATTASPLSAASPYLSTAATNNPGEMAASYMSPYARTAAQGLSDISQRNIMNNLAPGATAATVGAGQFGSQRGAQVLGQTQAQANADLNAKIAEMMNTGYGQALQAAGQQQTLLGQLGSTAGQLQSTGQQNLTQAGLAQSQLAGQNQALNLSGLSALSTLGGQQQTIGQNQQNFPLTKLANLAALMQGQQVPSTVTTQMNMSPLSTLFALGTGAGGLFAGTGTNGTGPSMFQQITGKTPAEFFNTATPPPDTTTPIVDQSGGENSGGSGTWDDSGNWVPNPGGASDYVGG